MKFAACDTATNMRTEMSDLRCTLKGINSGIVDVCGPIENKGQKLVELKICWTSKAPLYQARSTEPKFSLRGRSNFE